MNQGFSMLLENLLTQGDEQRHRNQQLTDAAKGVDFLVKANKPYDEKKPNPMLAAMGLTDETYAHLGSLDKVKMGDAYTKFTTMKQATEEFQAQQDERRARLDELKRKTVANSALEDAVGAATAPAQSGPPMQVPSDVPPALAMALNGANNFAQQPQELTPETLLAGVGKNRAAINSPNFDNVLRAMEIGNKGRDSKMVYDKTSLPNATVVKTATGNGFQIWPTGAPQTQMVSDGNGGQVPVMTVPGSRTATQIKGGVTQKDEFNALLAQKKEFIRAKAGSFNPLEKEEYDKEIADINNQMKALQPGGKTSESAPAPATAASAAAPKKGDLVKGYKFLGGDPAVKTNWQKQ